MSNLNEETACLAELETMLHNYDGSAPFAEWAKAYIAGHPSQFDLSTIVKYIHPINESASSKKLAERRMLARQINYQYPGSGWCQRCNLNWQVTRYHTTWFLNDDTGGHGVSPLCEDCWQECSTDERLSFYRLLWNEYALESNDYEQEWSLVEQAVREGK